MTATMLRPAANRSTETNGSALPVGSDTQQPKEFSEPNEPPAAAPHVPQEQDRRQAICGPMPSLSTLAGVSGMLLWDPLLQTLASGLGDIESARIAQANRLRILTATKPDADGEVRGFGLDERHPAVAALQVQLATLAELEKGMTKALAKQLKNHPLHPWIKAQIGLGDKQVARLLAAIRDPYWNDLHDRPRTVSELWAFCGLHVLPGSTRGGGGTGQGDHRHQPHIAGVAPARRRGERANWSSEARARCFVIAESCIKHRQGPYRPVYDDGRAKYAESVHLAPCLRCGPSGKPAQIGSPLSDGHKHARAMRLVMKRVLLDLWVESKLIYSTSP